GRSRAQQGAAGRSRAQQGMAGRSRAQQGAAHCTKAKEARDMPRASYILLALLGLYCGHDAYHKRDSA
ncbi:MAG: hypothetical protein ACR2IJ_05115, partial [Fluviibacter sp.]